MKLSRNALSLSISLCSTLLLCSMSAQLTKADSPDTQQSVNAPTADTTSVTKAVSDNTEKQTVNFTFVDNKGNKVVNSEGTPFTLSNEYAVGSFIDPSSMADEVNTKLNGGYTIDPNQDSIKVGDNNNPVQIKVTPKTYDLAVVIKSADGATEDNIQNKESVVVGQKSTTITYSGNGITNKPITEQSYRGYDFSYFTYRNGERVTNSNSDGTLTFTYDMIPDLQKSKQLNIESSYLIYAFCGKSLNQTLSIRHVYNQYNQTNDIPDYTYYEEISNKYKTGDVINDPLSLINDDDKDIPTYTYVGTKKPYTVSDGYNEIRLIYKKNDLNYLNVNYINKNTNKIIFTDYIPGNIGDSVTIRDIQKINDLNNYKGYKMVDSNIPDSYTIKANNENLNVYVEPIATTIKLVQSTENNLKLTSTHVIDYNDYFVPSNLTYLYDNISDVNSVEIDIGTEKVPFDLDNLKAAGATTAEIFNDVFGYYNYSFQIPELNTDNPIIFNINYTPSIKTINIKYQTPTNNTVNTISTSSADVSETVNSNLPKGYEFVNPDDPYIIKSFTTDVTNLTVPVKKISTPGNSGGSGGSHNTGDKTAIEETISTHPSSSEINIYDNNGQRTGQTISSNNDLQTDQKLQLNGKTYYRIANDQWISADDVYLYYDDPLDVKTHSNSAMKLVNSTGKAVTDRMLMPDSDWFTDRYTYLNDQKYYRVSTNEWINADDVFEYQPLDLVVQPTSNAKLYDDFGNFIKNSPSYSLKTDKISTINGVKMYRVATNQWLPVTDTK